jgi:hypothetical protein
MSVVLALIVAAPIAAGKNAPSSGDLDKAELTQEWWTWAMTDPSPLDGSYNGGEQCNGEFVDGVFFLAGAAFDPNNLEVNRTCTVPPNTPILFPVVNVICSEAWSEDPTPYDQCATDITDQTVDPPSTWYATLDGKDLKMQRIASGIFDWTIESNNNPFLRPAGTYQAGSDGQWVLLEDGLKKGTYTVQFGGTFKDTPFGDFEGAKVTYTLNVTK